MLASFFRTRQPRKVAAGSFFRPSIEPLEDRCLLDATPVPAPPNIFQMVSNAIKSLELYRNGCHQVGDQLKQQELTNLGDVLSLARNLEQNAADQVNQAASKVNTDVSTGASTAQQTSDVLSLLGAMLNAQAVNQSVANTVPAVEQKVANDLQTIDKAESAVDQDVNNAESQIVTLVSAAANQAQAQVGSPLGAGQTAKYSGLFTVVTAVPGSNTNTQVSLGVTVNVGSDGVTLTGPAQENINVFQGGTPVASENSTAGSINARLRAPNQTAVSGAFTFTISSGTGPAQFTGNIGTTKFVGTITDPSSGVQSPFSLDRVQ